MRTDYKEFFEKYGASVRRKNLHNPLRGIFASRSKMRDRPVFTLPSKSALPLEFIRLCPWEMEFLYTIARRATKGIVEVGRFNGGSTFVMAYANPSVPIWSVDIAPQDDERLKTLFYKNDVGSEVQLIVGDSQNTKYDEVGPYDVLFIDGDHSYEGCLADIRNWYDDLAPGGYMLLHDSYLSTPTNGVQDSIMTFMEGRDDLEVIVSPLIGASYWRYPRGSMACLRKNKQAA